VIPHVKRVKKEVKKGLNFNLMASSHSGEPAKVVIFQDIFMVLSRFPSEGCITSFESRPQKSINCKLNFSCEETNYCNLIAAFVLNDSTARFCHSGDIEISGEIE
jgi:hypothetical protein